MIKEPKYDFNRLTKEENEKFERIYKMLNQRKPFEEEVETLAEQVNFIRRHGKGKERFYSDAFYQSEPIRTRAIYYKVREQYVKKFRYDKKKYARAQESMMRLVEKATVPTQVNI